MNRIMSDWRTGELKIVPRILRAKGDRTYERYTIKGYYEGGKRCQRIFRTRKEAESLLQICFNRKDSNTSNLDSADFRACSTYGPIYR